MENLHIRPGLQLVTEGVAQHVSNPGIVTWTGDRWVPISDLAIWSNDKWHLVSLLPDRTEDLKQLLFATNYAGPSPMIPNSLDDDDE